MAPTQPRTYGYKNAHDFAVELLTPLRGDRNGIHVYEALFGDMCACQEAMMPHDPGWLEDVLCEMEEWGREYVLDEPWCDEHWRPEEACLEDYEATCDAAQEAMQYRRDLEHAHDSRFSGLK